MNIIQKRYIFLSISGLLVIAGIVAVGVYGFKQGIDFKGGTLWSLHIPNAQNASDVKSYFSDTFHKDAVITRDQNGNYLLRFDDVNETEHQMYLGELQKKYNEVKELSFQSIGPSIGNELRRNALIALVFVLIGISLYIAFAFRKVSQPVSSWKYGAVTLLTLFHDVVIPAGMFALLGRYVGAEIDTNFVVALLVVVGFSVHDTIVVFDRIRENLITTRDKNDLKAVVNKSLNETIARSLNTSLTLIIVLFALYFFGPETLKYFILTILVGVTAGTYSSIFVASPLLTVWHDLGKKR